MNIWVNQNIMSKVLDELKARLKEKSFSTQMYRGLKNKTIKKFDDEFYSRFDGMYFNGLPL